MAKSVNTHRRNVRARTPLSAVGRNAAGVAVAAGLVLTSGLVANADETQAGGAVDSAAPVKTEKLQPTAAPAVEVPAVNIPEGEGFGAPSLPVFSVKAPEKPKEEVRAEESRPAATTERAERRAETNQRERRAASRSAERREVSPQQQTEESKPAKTEESKPAKKAEKKKAPAASASSSAIVNTARRGIGTPYVWGGSGRNGWDCSGFTQWVFRQHGINLPHNDAMQASMGRRVSRSEARPGDLIRKPGHVGIYVGNGKMIDAGNKRVGTTERKIYSGNWSFYRIGG
ncbi:NlpC/P60 family protein [Dermabacteraceae bacterium P7074]